MLKNLNGDDERRTRALQALSIPGSFISVLDDEFQTVRTAHNFALERSTRQNSLCRHVVDSDSAVIVTDTYLDARFVTHPLITGAPFIRFYAGVPLKNCEGIILGTLCVTDTAPHPFGADQVSTLKLLSTLVMSFLEA